MSRPSKISKLPRSIRDELNLRLERQDSGSEITHWLNSLPVVQEVLSASFHNEPVSEQNLSTWRRTGFAAWQARQEFFDRLQALSDEAVDLESTDALMIDHAARLLAIHFALALSPSVSLNTPAPSEAPDVPEPLPSSPVNESVPSTGFEIPKNLKPLCEIARAVSSLRRDDERHIRFKIFLARIRSMDPSDPARSRTEVDKIIRNRTAPATTSSSKAKSSYSALAS